ncbi:MAG TPA: glycoside hydrolase family 3 C-terminal domain-containing protein [Bacteroidales bacterium]|nr:glycoside hydrolase family 3 C-terminal domain-containing protein [Bacteroidales bacterium]
MKKIFRILIKVLLALVGLILVIVIVAGLYMYSNFVNVDKSDSFRDVAVKEITAGGYSFLDLNRNGKLDIYEDNRNPMNERVSDLLSQMTSDEKIRMLRGAGLKTVFSLDASNEVVSGAAGTISAVPRLGIPTVFLSDGPAGLRINPTRKHSDKTYYCTAFPIGTLLASTWDVGLVEKVGEAMGNEALEYGVDVILGPGVNIQRNPLNGRNFEYYSEDPVVTGDIGAAMVNGIESNGVGASVKHFVANSQETNRNYNNAIISERALREIYLKGFEIIVKKAQPWTIMSSYNKVNGTYTSQSRYLLTDILRNDWDFRGVVMTDWYGGKNPPAQIHAGNDLLEPGTKIQYRALKKAEKNGELSQQDIDTSVTRILKLILNSKKMSLARFSDNPDLKAHAAVTRRSADEGMILLKNNGVLPFNGISNIALFGDFSYDLIAGGTGSGDVNEAYVVTPAEGLANAGFTINAEAKKMYDAFKQAHEKEFKKPSGTLRAMLTAYNPPEMNTGKEQLGQCAASSDIAVVTIGRNSGEGRDRVEKNDFLLSDGEQEMIKNVCEAYHSAGKKVVVVLNIGGVIETDSWKDAPDAILLAWQGGEEGGNSVADILSGKVNPCGKLPMTFPVALADHASSANFPMQGLPMSAKSFLFGSKTKPETEQVKNVDYTKYEEGIYVGYRYFDTKNIEVSYPFGYGMSYTSFKYTDMNVNVTNDTINIKVKVKNTGERTGKEVVEIYVSKPDSGIDRPVHELKAFAKTGLVNSGESAELEMSIPAADLSYWDDTTSSWKLEPGTYIINAAASSRDTRLSKEIML